MVSLTRSLRGTRAQGSFIFLRWNWFHSRHCPFTPSRASSLCTFSYDDALICVLMIFILSGRGGPRSAGLTRSRNPAPQKPAPDFGILKPSPDENIHMHISYFPDDDLLNSIPTTPGTPPVKTLNIQYHIIRYPVLQIHSQIEWNGTRNTKNAPSMHHRTPSVTYYLHVSFFLITLIAI